MRYAIGPFFAPAYGCAVPAIFDAMSHRKNMVDDADDIELNTSESAWYDLWHTHVDWDGRGNVDKASREHSVAKLFRTFEAALSQAQRLSGPSNVWLLFVPENSEEDSVYVHTPNPNGTAFPYQFEGVSWDVEAPQELLAHLRPEFEVGFSSYGGATYWVRVRKAT